MIPRQDTQSEAGSEKPFRLSRRSLAALALLFLLLVVSLANAIRYFTPEKLVPKLLNPDRALALDNTTRFFNSLACLQGDLPRDQVVGFWSPIVEDRLIDHFQQYFRMAQYAVAPVRLDAVGSLGEETTPGEVDTIVFDAVGVDILTLKTQSDYPLIIAFTPDNPKSGLSPLPGYALLQSCGEGIYLVSREAEP
jgi:hypothetical protein